MISTSLGRPPCKNKRHRDSSTVCWCLSTFVPTCGPDAFSVQDIHSIGGHWHSIACCIDRGDGRPCQCRRICPLLLMPKSCTRDSFRRATCQPSASARPRAESKIMNFIFHKILNRVHSHLPVFSYCHRLWLAFCAFCGYMLC